MTSPAPKLVIVCQGMRPETVRLQPWRYLHEIALQLQALGWESMILTDGKNHDTIQKINGIPVVQLGTVQNYFWRTNSELEKALESIHPDVVVWSLGLTSLAHQKNLPVNHARMVGVFSSPINSLKDLWRIGPRKLFSELQLSGIHLLGTLVPKFFLRLLAKRFLNPDALVFQTESTRKYFEAHRLLSGPTQVIQPGIDPIWMRGHRLATQSSRRVLGYTSEELVVVYFGSPAALRGSLELVQAFETAAEVEPDLRLLLLSRARTGELDRETKRLVKAVENSPVRDKIQIVDGFLEHDALVEIISDSQVVALPFELVPSDAPLSLLEAAALGKLLVTTRVACLPELAAHTSHYLAEVGNHQSLAEALLEAARFARETSPSQGKSFARGWAEMGREWLHLLETL
jgi:glycosyltransferase involved in cell wall biosynthesis